MTLPALARSAFAKQHDTTEHATGTSNPTAAHITLGTFAAEQLRQLQ
jgi:hypothetical protein